MSSSNSGGRSSRRNATAATASTTTTTNDNNNSKKYRNPLYILYGSATGNSENIAKDLTKLITAHLTTANDDVKLLTSKQQQMMNAHTGGSGTTTKTASPYRLDPVFDGVICCELDQYKKMGALALWESPLQQPTIDDTDAQQQQQQQQPLQYQYRGVIIVCSTTGNGDAPENACRFVRHIKKAATAVKDKDNISNLLFQNVCYTILGLGDTNYDQYCAAAITIDRYIHLLGGHRSPTNIMKHLICADEGSGQLEDVVDPWMKTIVQQMVQACSCPNSSSSSSAVSTTTIGVSIPQNGMKEEMKEEEKEEVNALEPVSTTSTIVTDVVPPPPPVPIPTTNTSVVEATTTTTASSVSSLGVQMVQSVLQQQQQLSSSTTTDYSNIQIIDPSMLPTLITKPIIPGDDSFVNSNKPFTFVQQYDTIDEEKEVTANTDTITTAAAVQRRLRGLSIGSATSGGGGGDQQQQQHIAIPDDATASSVSAGYYYNYNNPYESQIIQARYLTHQTSIDAAQQVTDQLKQQQQQQQKTTSNKPEMNGTTAKKMNDNYSVWTPSLYSKAEDIYDAAFPLRPKETTESSSVSGNVEYDKNGKRVIEITLSIPDDTTLIEYEPGDSLGLLIDNPISMVQYMVQLVQQNDITITNPYEQLIVLHHHDGINNNTNSIKTRTPITIVDAISRYLDLCSVIKNKRILYALSLLASDPIESYYLQLMSSKLDIGVILYSQIIDEQRYNIVDLIQYVFPSLQSNITLDVLFTIVPNSIPTRYYSVSSSPLQQQQYNTTTNGSDHHQQRFLTIAFSVVDYITPSFCLTGNATTTTPKEVGRRRIHGIATRYLEAISSPLLICNSSSKVSTRTTDYQTPSNNLPISTVRIFPKPTIDFRMPQSLLTPIILIGPGTGIAPFIGFLRHRQVLYRRYQQKTLQQVQQHPHHSNDHTPAQTIVEGTWRGGYELSSDGITNELAISQQDESGLNVGADYRIQQQQKQHGQQQSSSLSNICGPVDVFFGCRHKDHDWIYRDEMNEFVQEGIISNLYTAFSRENDDDDNNNNTTGSRNGTIRRSYKYVQDRMIHDPECRTRLIDMIMEQNAIVYVCGDGNAMGQDVQTAIVTILSKYHFHKNNSSSNDDDDTINTDGKLYLEEMKRQQRFLMDIWS